MQPPPLPAKIARPQPEPEPQPAPEPEPEPEPAPEPAPEPVPEPISSLAGLPSASDYCRWGISARGIATFIAQHSAEIAAKTTTSDVCHRLIKPATTPAGWRDEPQLTDEKRRWYKHQYRNEQTGVLQDEPPPGTRSMCDILQSQPETSHMVGRANVFFSHAWRFCFREVSAALSAFTASTIGAAAVDEDELDLHEQKELYFWFDCFSVDEHATQSYTVEWWSSTFKEAIGLIGHTCMLFTPWSKPEPLTRAWCLWELYCTIVEGSHLSVCLGPTERREFERRLLEDPDVVLDAFARIDVENAQAGKESDREMILAAAREMDGGLAKLNRESIQRLREWVVHIAVGMADKAMLGAIGVKFRMGRERTGSIGSKRLEFAGLGSQLLGHDRQNFEQLLTVALFLAQLHEGLEHANRLHEEFIKFQTEKLREANPSDPLVFRSKLLHANLLWNGRWGSDLEQMANNKIALAEYEDLVFSDVWKDTVRVQDPDRLRAMTEWVETKINSKRLELTDENLAKVRTVLQKAIAGHQRKERTRQEMWAKMLLARAIHVNARNMTVVDDDDLKTKREKLAEAQTLLSEEVEPFFVHELGERHVSTTEVHEEMGKILIEDAQLEDCVHSRAVKFGKANSLFGEVEVRRVEMLGEDHAAVGSLRKSKSWRPRSSTGMHQMQADQGQFALRRQKSKISFQVVTDDFELPQLSSVPDNGSEAVSARFDDSISTTKGDSAPSISAAAMSQARTKLEKHTKRVILSNHLSDRAQSSSSGGGGSNISPKATASAIADPGTTEQPPRALYQAIGGPPPPPPPPPPVPQPTVAEARSPTPPSSSPSLGAAAAVAAGCDDDHGELLRARLAEAEQELRATNRIVQQLQAENAMLRQHTERSDPRPAAARTVAAMVELRGTLRTTCGMMEGWPELGACASAPEPGREPAPAVVSATPLPRALAKARAQGARNGAPSKAERVAARRGQPREPREAARATQFDM